MVTINGYPVEAMAQPGAYLSLTALGAPAIASHSARAILRSPLSLARRCPLGARVQTPNQYLPSQPRQYRALFDLEG